MVISLPWSHCNARAKVGCVPHAVPRARRASGDATAARRSASPRAGTRCAQPDARSRAVLARVATCCTKPGTAGQSWFRRLAGSASCGLRLGSGVLSPPASAAPRDDAGNAVGVDLMALQQPTQRRAIEPQSLAARETLPPVRRGTSSGQPDPARRPEWAARWARWARGRLTGRDRRQRRVRAHGLAATGGLPEYGSAARRLGAGGGLRCASPARPGGLGGAAHFDQKLAHIARPVTQQAGFDEGVMGPTRPRLATQHQLDQPGDLLGALAQRRQRDLGRPRRKYRSSRSRPAATCSRSAACDAEHTRGGRPAADARRRPAAPRFSNRRSSFGLHCRP